MTSTEMAKPRLRPLTEADTTGAAQLLAEGFPRRTVAYWQQALERLWRLERPNEIPHPGYVIEDNSRLVGIILILAQINPLAGSKPRANLSSWYVKPQYRSFGTLLLTRASKEKDLTFLNVSPAESTYAICQALGFKLYSEGQFLNVPLLSASGSGEGVCEFDSRRVHVEGSMQKLLADHQSYGCVCLVSKGQGRSEAFVFVKRRIKGFIPIAQLVYCSSEFAYLAYARAIGKALLNHGIAFVIMDASGPKEKLLGRYFPGKVPKYFKGPEAPRQNDLAYTEIAVFGI